MVRKDVFEGYGIEISLADRQDFLKICETLTRIGEESENDTLFQMCHILHKQGHYAILHYKELYLMDGKQSDLTEEDLERRNTIVALLREWKLATIVDPSQFAREERAPMSDIKIIPYRNKDDWKLQPKYSIGKKKR